MTTLLRIAYFISPHGFGHAARACAVMTALAAQQPCQFEIFTTVPEWFFAESLLYPFTYHTCQTDVGLVQLSSVREDLPATLQRLAALLPYRPWFLQTLAQQVQASGCQLVCCDIAPLGVAVAQQLGLPSVLIENFTWDYIYSGYAQEAPELAHYGQYLARWRAQADLCIQAAPITERQPDLPRVDPISRAMRETRAALRLRLQLPALPAVLLTMGGHNMSYQFIAQLQEHPNVTFVLPGAAERLTWQGNCLLLPTHGVCYHPDLVNSSDLVVGKLGYSTVAEAWQAGVPFAYLPRPQFRESAVVAAWLTEELACAPIEPVAWDNGSWLTMLPALLRLTRRVETRQNGATQAAALILTRYGAAHQ